MAKNFTEAFAQTIRLVVVFLGFVIGMSSCTEEYFGDPIIKPTPELPTGEETADFRYLQLYHNDWAYSNGLAKAEPSYNGLVRVMRKNEEVRSIRVDNQIVEQLIVWEPIAEVVGDAAVKQFVNYSTGDVKEVSKENNQGLIITKFEKECKLNFDGMVVVLKGSWKEASFGAEKADRCEYNYTTVISQVSDTAMVDGAKVEIIVDGVKYNRINVIAKAENHFNDYVNGQKSSHKEEMDIVYSTLVKAPVVETIEEPTPDPNMPDEIGTVDVVKTKQFGGLSWCWDESGKAFISGTIVTEHGVISFWNGDYCFHKMNTNTIKGRLGNSLYPENANQRLIPSYIDVQTKPNIHWVYTDVNGKVRSEVYGTFIEKLKDVTLRQPFFGTPSETSETYNITSQDGSVRVKVVYEGSVVFDHVFTN